MHEKVRCAQVYSHWGAIFFQTKALKIFSNLVAKYDYY